MVDAARDRIPEDCHSERDRARSAKERESRKPYTRHGLLLLFACKKKVMDRSQGMKPLVRGILVTLAAVTLAAAQSAPSKPAEVRGIVTDPLTARIAGATVTFTAVQTGAEVSVRTADLGSYRALLAPGSYRVSVKAPNFRTDTSRSIEALSGKTQQLDFEMQVAVYVDGVEVPAVPEQPVSEPQSTPGISVIKFVPPVYPPLARTARIQGDVRVLVDIAPDGSAKSVSVLSGHPMLSTAATDAVKQWRFGCQRCEQPLRHVVTIAFLLDDTLPGDCNGPRPEALLCVEPALPSRVTVRSGSPAVEISSCMPERIRAKRCLWLWRCQLVYCL
jgi:TonB family protein